MASPARASATDASGARSSVTSPSSARASVAQAPAAKPEKVVQLAGEGLGYPVYHAITGNLPVLTPRFHHPPGTSEDVTGGPSDYALITGNLPVLSRELLPTIEEELMPGWVELHDPVRGKTFFWNIYYRAFRDTRPEPNDDGRRGARHGEQHLYRTQMAHVRATLLERAALSRVDAEESGEGGSGHDADGSGSSAEEDDEEEADASTGGAGAMPGGFPRPGGFGMGMGMGMGMGRSVLTAAERKEKAAKRRLARSVRRAYALLMRRSITTVAAVAGAAAARGGPGAAAAASAASVPPKELALPPAFTPLFFWDAARLTALKLAGTTFDSSVTRAADDGYGSAGAGAGAGSEAMGGAGGPSTSSSGAAAGGGGSTRGAPPMVLVVDGDSSAGDGRASGPGRPGGSGAGSGAGLGPGGSKPMAMLSEADLSDDDEDADADKDKDKGSDDGSGSDGDKDAGKDEASTPALSAADEAVLAAVESPSSGKAWVELFCTAQQRCYYVNRRTREVTWDSPVGDAYLNDCDQYERKWQLHWDAAAKAASYSLVADTTGSSRRDHWTAASPGEAPPASARPDGTPDGYDGPLVVDYWEEFETEVEDTGAASSGAGAEGGEGGDGSASSPRSMRKYYVNSLTESTQWDKPDGWPRKVPDTPPPPLPVRPPPKAVKPAVEKPAASGRASGSGAVAAPGSPAGKAADAAGSAGAAGASPVSVSSPGAAGGAGAGAPANARKRRGTSALGSGPGSGVGGVGSAGPKAGTSAPAKVSAAVASLAASGFGAGGRPPSPPLLDPEAEATMEDYLGDADVEVFFNEDGGENGGGANDDTIVYPSYRGYLKKKGGGTSIFGRKSWKERFFVFSRGNLCYFETQADWEKGTEPLKALQISLRYYRVDPRTNEPLQFALIPNYKVVMAEEMAAENGIGGDGSVGAGRSRASSAATRASVIVAAATPAVGAASPGLRTASGRASAPAMPASSSARDVSAGAGSAESPAAAAESAATAASASSGESPAGVAALVGVGLKRFGGGSALPIALKRPGPAPRAEPGELPYGRISRLPPPSLGRVLSGRVLRADGSSAPPGPDDDREEAGAARSARSLGASAPASAAGAAGALGSPGFGPLSLSSPGSPSLGGTVGSSVGSLRLGSPSAAAGDSSYASSTDDESAGGGSARGRAGTAPAVFGGPAPDGSVLAAGAPSSGLSAASRRRRTSFATMKDQQAAAAPDSFEVQAAKKASLAARVFELEAPTPEVKAKWVRALRGRRADGRHRADSPEYATLYAAVAAARAALGDGAFQSVNPAAGMVGRPKSGSGNPVGGAGAAAGGAAGGAGAGSGSFSPGSPLTGSAGAAAAAAAAAGSKTRGRRMTTML